MKTLVTLAAIAMTTLVTGHSSADEYDTANRRPIDNLLGTWFDHSFTTYHWDGDATEYCAESFGGDCSCDSQSRTGSYPNNCTVVAQGDEAYGQLWGYQCGQWLSNQSYGSWGVCHQATANLSWYVTGDGSSIANAGGGIRGWSWSVGLWGVYGSDGGAGCY